MASDSDNREGCTPGGCRVKVHKYRQSNLSTNHHWTGSLLLLEVVCPKGEIMHATNG